PPNAPPQVLPCASPSTWKMPSLCAASARVEPSASVATHAAVHVLPWFFFTFAPSHRKGTRRPPTGRITVSSKFCLAGPLRARPSMLRRARAQGTLSGIADDAKTLACNCFAAGMRIFDISDVTNVHEIGYQVRAGEHRRRLRERRHFG